MPFMIVIFLIFLCIFQAKRGVKRDYENEELKKKIEKMEQKRIQSEAVKEEVKQISKYLTYELIYTEVIRFSDQNEFRGIKIPLTGSYFIASIDGKANIGIDGDRIQFSEITDAEGRVVQVKLSVPHSEILDNYTDHSTLKILDEQNNIFNPIRPEEYNELLIEAERQEERKILKSDILQKSDQTIRYLLTSHFQAVYGDGVEIKYAYVSGKAE